MIRKGYAMKKIFSILLCITVILSATAFSSAAFALNRNDNTSAVAVWDDDAFLRMTPQEQYETILSQEDDAEAARLLSLLNAEQLAALEQYKQSLEAQRSDASESEAPAESGTDEEEPPAAEESAQASGGTDSPGIDYSAMTPQELYEYLLTLESDEEINAVISALTPEQYAALDACAQSVAEAEQKQTEDASAENYTNAASFENPVNVSAVMSAMRALGDEEDALVLDKTVSEANGSYTLTIEAYATGEVSITTGETPVPADIILVLDVSRSMNSDMNSGYASITFSKNNDAYNYDDDLFIKVDGHYYALTITRVKTGGNRYKYTYSYTIGSTPYSYTSDDDARNDPPPSALNFYYASTVSRLAALKSAANSFLDSIEDKANSDEGVDHRIAIVTYSDSASVISGGRTTSTAFVGAYNNTSGINTLQSAINGLSVDMYTRSDLGLQKAGDIFRDDSPDASGPRNRVVVFFTDGAPASGGIGEFETAVANDALAAAKMLKAPSSASGYGATVYAIGIFDGANPTTPIASASNENKFMHFVSSNYPNAASMTNYGAKEKDGFYLSAADTAGLNSIFQSISENIEVGGTSVELDETSVIKDMIETYFELPAGANVSSIHLFTSEADEDTGAWLTRQPFSGSVSISSDRRTVGVSGFDYAENYYAAIETNGVITGYQGKKLIIEIPIEYIEGSCFGGTVPTNQPTSGVYDSDILVEALPIPTVDIPVSYDFTALDQPIYLTQDAALDGLFEEAPRSVANGINNAYVDIVYTVKNAGETVLSVYTIPAGESDGSWNITDFTLEGLTANTTYTVDCTVTPVSGPVSPASLTKTASVWVWKPEIIWRDSVIYLGETADYDDNFVSLTWRNSSASAPAPAGAAPTLTYQYTPAAAAFAANTHVSTAVKIGSADVTAYTHFLHEACIFPGCGYNPASGEFMVHVKTCSLTIAKTGAADPTDTFIFTVTGGGQALRVSVQGNGSATVTGLPVGSYTIAEDTAWSWRYEAEDAQVTLSASNDFGAATIGNAVTNDKWLGGDSRAANTFPAGS